MKYLILLIALATLLFSCGTLATDSSDRASAPKATETFKAMIAAITAARQEYGVFMSKMDGYTVLNYGGPVALEEYNGGIAHGSPQYIFYSNPGFKYDLHSILINAKYKGEPLSVFNFKIIDLNGQIHLS